MCKKLLKFSKAVVRGNLFYPKVIYKKYLNPRELCTGTLVEKFFLYQDFPKKKTNRLSRQIGGLTDRQTGRQTEREDLELAQGEVVEVHSISKVQRMDNQEFLY